MYAAAFLDHFQDPRHLGALEDATHRGRAEDDACGDVLWLDLLIRDETVREARFRVDGCAGAIAVGSALATLLHGRSARVDAVSKEELTALLGEVPPGKRHALGLAVRALAAALRGS